MLIVGGGYAGLHAARAAAAEGAPVTIVDDAGVHGFTTRLAAVAGGTAPVGDAFAPLDVFGHSSRTGYHSTKKTSKMKTSKTKNSKTTSR